MPTLGTYVRITAAGVENATLEDAAGDAVGLAALTCRAVLFRFEGVDLVVTGNDTVEGVCQKWREQKQP